MIRRPHVSRLSAVLLALLLPPLGTWLWFGGSWWSWTVLLLAAVGQGVFWGAMAGPGALLWLGLAGVSAVSVLAFARSRR